MPGAIGSVVTLHQPSASRVAAGQLAAMIGANTSWPSRKSESISTSLASGANSASVTRPSGCTSGELMVRVWATLVSSLDGAAAAAPSIQVILTLLGPPPARTGG